MVSVLPLRTPGCTVVGHAGRAKSEWPEHEKGNRSEVLGCGPSIYCLHAVGVVLPVVLWTWGWALAWLGQRWSC